MLYFNIEELFLNIWVFIGILIFIVTGPVASLLWLLIYFCFGSLILVAYGLDYLAFLLILVYAGAVVVLFLFILMFLNVRIFENFDFSKTFNWVNLLLSLLLLLFFFFLLSFMNLDVISYNNNFLDILNINWLDLDMHNIKLFGSTIFDHYFLTFLLLCCILFISLDGVLYLVLDFISFLYKLVIWSFGL